MGVLFEFRNTLVTKGDHYTQKVHTIVAAPFDVQIIRYFKSKPYTLNFFFFLDIKKRLPFFTLKRRRWKQIIIVFA